jgi:hypothetical protein
LLLRRGVGEILEGSEGPLPELIKVGAKDRKASRIGLIKPPGPGAVVNDQADVLEHLQVLRNGWPTDRQGSRKLADRTRAVGEMIEDGLPGRIAERGQHRSSVRHDER